jgi:hypothetical protein
MRQEHAERQPSAQAIEYFCTTVLCPRYEAAIKAAGSGNCVPDYE